MSRLVSVLVVILAGLLATPPIVYAQDAAGKPKKQRKQKKKKRVTKQKKRTKKKATQAAKKAKKKRTKGRKAVSLDEAAKIAKAGKAKAPDKKKAGKKAKQANKTKKKAAKGTKAKKQEPRYKRVTRVEGSLLSHFRTVLSAFGTWTKHSKFGLVWTPSTDEVGWRFTPYVNDGHWAVTKRGSWTWVSDYDWGHIPFHYGNWEWDDSEGWMWIPATKWAPAWVNWRVAQKGYDYVAWAPMPATSSVTHTAKHGYVRKRLAQKSPLRFMFVFNQYLFSPGVGSHMVWDPRVSAWLGARSKTVSKYARNPTFKQAHLPGYLTPLGRIKLTDPRIAAFVVKRK